MKKFLCLVMGILLILSSILFVACDTSKENESGTGSETGGVEAGSESGSTENTDGSSTEAVTGGEGNEDGVTVVDNIAGKSAYEACLAYFESNMDNYTLTSNIVTVTEFGSSKTQNTANVVVSLAGETAHVVMSSPDTPYYSGEYWYTDGYYYTNSLEEKYKEEMTFEDFSYYCLSEYAPDYSELGLEESIFEGVAIEQNKDGEYRIFLDLTEVLAEEMGSEELSSYKVTVEFVFNKDGSIKATCVYLESSMEMDGIMVYSTNTWETGYSNIGTTEVTLPDDLDTYEDWGSDIEDNFEIPDMSDWTDEEIESWYNEFWGADEEEKEEIENEVTDNIDSEDPENEE